MHRPSGSSAGRSTRFCASLLILMLIQDPAFLLGEGALLRHKHVPPPAKQLAGEERILHALNRLTFGPRPGDVERVKAIGLKKWIDLQLNPERIDDSLLDAQLRNYPAMSTPLPALIEQFPTAAQIRLAADGKIPLPQNRVERAIYQNQIWDYEQRKQKQAEEARLQIPSAPPSAEPVAMNSPQMQGAAAPCRRPERKPSNGSGSKSAGKGQGRCAGRCDSP